MEGQGQDVASSPGLDEKPVPLAGLRVWDNRCPSVDGESVSLWKAKKISVAESDLGDFRKAFDT